MVKNPPQTPRRKRTHRRNVLLAMDYYFLPFREGVTRYAGEAGWDLDQRMCLIQRVPKEWHGQGIIAVAFTPQTMRELVRFHRPIVSMSGTPLGGKFPSINSDDHAAGRLGAEHLLERGFRRLAFFRPSITNASVQVFHQGFVEAVRDAGRECLPLDWEGGNLGRFVHRKRMTLWLAKKLQSLGTPLGVMAPSDLWAIEVMRACEVAGLTIPDRVAVVGVDNDPFYNRLAPVPITSVDINMQGVGYEAAAMLDRIMDGRKPPKKPVMVPPLGVVARQSTNILAVDNPHVARALAFIFEHFAQPIRVEEIAARAELSLRRLQVQFRKAIGRTLVQEITRLRLEMARELLHTTDSKAETIARRCGLGGSRYLSVLFGRHFGQSIREFRKEVQRG